jgi:imidazolonepropionase-like amidohydrolase
MTTKNGVAPCLMGDTTGSIKPGKFSHTIVFGEDPLAGVIIHKAMNGINMMILKGKV